MSIVSYGMRILDEYRIYDNTCRIYVRAVRMLIDVCDAHYPMLEVLQNSEDRMAYIERHVHNTKGRNAFYDFDAKFYKFPSYLRRSAIMEALGAVFAYHTALKKWSPDKGKKPTLGKPKRLMPCLYNENMFRIKGDEFFVKVYDKHDWVWHKAHIKQSDLLSISERIHKLGAPFLEKRHKRYYLRFATHTMSDKTFRKDKDVEKIIGVDLGVRHDAVCAALLKDGTVTGRKFIRSGVEKDRLVKVLHTIRKCYKNGSCHTKRLWRFVNNYQRTIEINTAKAIIEFSLKENADVIVFENLNSFHPSYMTEKIHLWRKRAIQRRVESMASRHGIRVSYVHAANTSKLAFDGSGPVTRDKKNFSVGTFASGKRYHVDLSASYNIGARYWLRVYEKTTPAKVWCGIEAKVPLVSLRTKQTLSTLINVARVTGIRAA